MEKNTLYAIVLSVLIITAGFYVQEKFFAAPAQEVQQESQAQIPPPSGVQAPPASASEARPAADPLPSGVQSSVDLTAVKSASGAEADPDYYRETTIDTEILTVVFSNLGGTVKSIKLKEHLDGDEPLEMINTNSDSFSAFNMHLGDHTAETLDVYFNTRKYTENNFIIVEFSKELEIPDRAGTPVPLSIVKKYILRPDEYMMELQIQLLNRDNTIIQLDNNGYAYTLGFGPQIGPVFEKLDNRNEFRKFLTAQGGKKKEMKMPKQQGEVEVYDRINWAAISGKYFAVIGITDATLYKTVFSNSSADGFEEGAQLFFSRPVIKSSNSVDTYRFYIGPKQASELRVYSESDRNAFNISGLDLDLVLDSGAMLGWLQAILKVLLSFFYGIIPNYGVAILLLTVLVKIIMFPLTHKSFESTSRMSELSPKLAVLKEKHKGNPQKLNAEISQLYKEAGVNPLGGCLPLLLQMPIFIALYGLLNSHFELRGATFLPPWITDLSTADTIYNFAPLSIPVIGSDIRLLPLLMIGTQLLSSKIMQTPEAAGNAQMKMMTYMMPIMFLFILYDAPSGLLLYWTMTNVLTVFQQLYINSRRRKKNA